MQIAVIALTGLALLSAAVVIHYKALLFAGVLLPWLPIRPQQRVLVVIAVCLTSHVLQIVLYAAAYATLYALPDFGTIMGEFEPTALDFFYFSLTSYTTLGIGEVYPIGPLRLIAGLESLNGFLSITWSASFTYMTMQPAWQSEADDRHPA